MTSYPKDRARRLVRSRLRSVASTDFQAQSQVAYDHLLSILNQLQWATMAELASVKLAPAVKEIVTAATAQRDFFFEEFQVASQ